MAEIDVRPAQRGDVRDISRVLAKAFYDDPVMSWMLPDDGSRLKSLTRAFAGLTRHHFLSRGGSEVGLSGGTLGATTLWDPPGQRKASRREELTMLPLMLWAFRSRVPASVQVMELMEEHHPEEPHWYLMVIGSDPSVRGAGFGQALMRSRLDRCDAEGVPAYLENSNPRNESYYLRFGFEVMGEITLPDGGPSMWPMWRQPR
ncbi:GNAT family N-acetyltransferase [Mycobacterium deserti]|uniref:GNAT family N-acetyltransferase n=1 Tax=Mycobacterium deserti TaxID=2978347 RepID=A0ABT2MFU5_9MYCO|nr:GNAT family N-acetyltransferase [Mycobacterium deserti]MCT7660399.1 GNAT family N-acetyltransferase [Mycobacterium deserti]